MFNEIITKTTKKINDNKTLTKTKKKYIDPVKITKKMNMIFSWKKHLKGRVIILTKYKQK